MPDAASFREWELEPFSARHVAAAADLVVTRLRAELVASPILPTTNADPAHHRPALESLAETGSGLAALRAGRLVGFLAGWIVESRVPGGDGVAWCPDVGHGTAEDDPRIVEALYAAVAARWVERGARTHVVTVAAGHRVTLDALWRFGFGHHVVDLVRDLSSPTVRGDPGVSIRTAGTADLDTIADLEAGLRAHLAASPVFLPSAAPAPAELHDRLADPDRPHFVAFDPDGRPVAYLRIGPCADDVAFLVRDTGTASISGAFTIPERRGGDVATALLVHAFAWGRDQGYVRCAVDHESANPEATRFWARHFVPVAHSLLRRLPPRAADPATADPAATA